jgi:hypothetical protein
LMTAKVFQLLLHDAHTDGNSNPRQGNITASAVRTSSSPRGVRRTPSRAAAAAIRYENDDVWGCIKDLAKSRSDGGV